MSKLINPVIRDHLGEKPPAANACKDCPSAMWYKSSGALQCFCTLMHQTTWIPDPRTRIRKGAAANVHVSECEGAGTGRSKERSKIRSACSNCDNACFYVDQGRCCIYCAVFAGTLEQGELVKDCNGTKGRASYEDGSL